jgi:pimeloyl-ACP methyl ester carboxylesterase
VPIVGLLHLQPVSVDDFTTSTFDGIDKLISRMYDEVRDCGSSTRFVLMGSSQGALAVHYALRQLASIDSTMLNRVAGVALVADPGRTSSSGETLWDGAESPASWWVSSSSGSWSSALVFDSDLQGPLPARVAAKTISICHFRDVVCSIAPLSGVVPHLTYSSNETNAMGRQLADMVGASLP